MQMTLYLLQIPSQQAIMRQVEKFLTTKLQLPINKEKMASVNPVQFQILGFDFVPTYQKGKKGNTNLWVGAKAWQRSSLKKKN